MTLDEFDNAIASLRNCFGDKAFNEKRCERIYKFAKHLSFFQFEQIVLGFIDSQRTPPLPLDFLISIRAKGWSSLEHQEANFFQKFQKCGHSAHSSKVKNLNGACVNCLKIGYLPEVIKYPYLLTFIPKQLHETAKTFQRQAQESLVDYARRTWKELRNVQKTYGLIFSADSKNSGIKPDLIKIFKNLSSG